MPQQPPTVGRPDGPAGFSDRPSDDRPPHGPAGVAGRTSGPRTGRPGSLALRTVLGVVVLLAVVLSAFTLTSLVLTGRTLDAQLEQSVNQVWERSAAFLLRGRDDPDDGFSHRDPVEASGQPAEMLVLVVDDETVVHASRLDEDGDAEELSARDAEVLSAIGAEALDDDDVVVRTVSLDVGRYLVQAEELDRDAVAITGLPTAPIAGTKASLTVLQVLGSVAALLLAGLLGWWWIRRSLRPLGEVSRAAARVAEMPMGSGEVSLAHCRIPEELARPADEVGAVGHALNRLIDSVDGAFEQRSRSEQRLRTFVADASHELRTPLAGVRGYAEMIRMTEPLSDRGKASLARVLQQADRMGSLVDDLLLLARLDSGPRIHGEQTDLGEVVVDAVMDASAAGRDHRWALDVPEHPVTVFGDRQQLAQLVANLLSNARKHTPAGTSVAVRLANGDGNGVEPGASDVRLSVEDDGPGIDQDLVPELFDRFVRGDAARSTTEGSTGLGLSIVRSIARAHGGDVAVESTPGRTVFTVRLPARSR